MNNIVFLKKGSDQRKNLFFIHAGNGEVSPYVLFCSNFPLELNCWGLRADRFNDFSPKNRSIYSMAKSYIKQIKKIQPQGPYLLAGWCFGGVRAFEIACQLELMGERVDFLSIINSAPPVINNMERANIVKNYSLLRQNDNPKKRVFFTTETEKDLIQKWFDLSGFIEVEEIIDWDKKGFWKDFVKLFTNSKYEDTIKEVIKRYVPEDRAKAIPYYDDINFSNLVYYLNVMRTDANAQAFYSPKRVLKTKVDFIEASCSLVKRRDEWNNYLEKSMEVSTVEGDHFSIFRMGQVEDFSKIFIELLRNRIKT